MNDVEPLHREDLCKGSFYYGSHGFLKYKNAIKTLEPDKVIFSSVREIMS